jgi:uncharacterized protein (TIGR00369 family)
MDPVPQVEAITAATGFTRDSAVDVLAVEPGAVSLRMPRSAAMLQFNGHFHGGAIAGLADHAAGAAATTALPAGRIAVTADLTIHFLKPASGASITARARTVSVGSLLCIATVEVTTECEPGPVVCAIATVTLRAVAAPA